MTLLDSDAKQRIEAAIAELEARTAAEVVVAIVPHSGRPWLSRALVAFGAGLAAAVLGFELGYTADPRVLLALELAVAFGAFALLGWRPLERRLVTAAAARREVEEHAFSLFARHGLYRTRGGTGVLILLSELEQSAVILGDRPIHERLGAEGWQTHIDRIVAAVRRGQAADGVVAVLGDLANVLAELAPVVGVNENELPDAVLDVR